MDIDATKASLLRQADELEAAGFAYAAETVRNAVTFINAQIAREAAEQDPQE